ncbi:MAG TPA: hypothetical protein GX717_06670 [Clostridiaceae bacterium]|nr:hypothetical protein [Clostridiaceae bacterium]
MINRFSKMILSCLVLTVFLSGCGGDKKANEIAGQMVEHKDEVQSFRNETTLAVDGKATQFIIDYDSTNQNMRLIQLGSDSEQLNLLRVDGQDYVSAGESESYQMVDRQTVGVIDYQYLMGMLVSEVYKSNENTDVIEFTGFDKQVFESVKAAYNLTFAGYSEADCTMDIAMKPDESGNYLESCDVHIVANHNESTSEVTITTKISQINDIEPIKAPDQADEPADPESSGTASDVSSSAFVQLAA